MKLVENLKEIEANAFLLADTIYLRNTAHSDAASLVAKGRAFFPFFYRGGLAFAPSRFIGYKANTVSRHIEQRSDSDGKITNRQIDRIIGSRYIEDESLSGELSKYARGIGITLEDRKHRFWLTESAKRYADRVGLATDDLHADGLGNDDPDYQQAMRSVYKRDPAVRKAVLKRAAGKCEFCGSISFAMSSGAAYLETHHILSLSQEGPDRTSNVIALCANHHREAHFGSDWKVLQTKFQKLLAKQAAK